MTVYIDRDEVLKKAWDADTRCGYVQVVDVSDIESAPTADVIEITHGRWVYDPDGIDWNIGAWRCSECGCKNDNLGSDRNINPYHYAGSKFCGNCGAKMTGDIKPTEICLATGLKCSKCTPGPCSSRKQV
jgi:hypothetical protein